MRTADQREVDGGNVYAPLLEAGIAWGPGALAEYSEKCSGGCVPTRVELPVSPEQFSDGPVAVGGMVYVVGAVLAAPGTVDSGVMAFDAGLGRVWESALDPTVIAPGFGFDAISAVTATSIYVDLSEPKPTLAPPMTVQIPLAGCGAVCTSFAWFTSQQSGAGGVSLAAGQLLFGAWRYTYGGNAYDPQNTAVCMNHDPSQGCWPVWQSATRSLYLGIIVAGGTLYLVDDTDVVHAYRPV